MPPIASATETAPSFVLEEEHLASRSSVRLLISARAQGEVEARARLIHRVSCHGDGPFVCADAGDLPSDDRLLRLMCVDLLECAAGGTLFIDGVETMPASVQNVFLALMNELAPEHDPSRTVRLNTGTSVSLLECIAAGSFAEALFYQLNIIHLTPVDGSASAFIAPTCSAHLS